MKKSINNKTDWHFFIGVGLIASINLLLILIIINITNYIIWI